MPFCTYKNNNIATDVPRTKRGVSEEGTAIYFEQWRVIIHEERQNQGMLAIVSIVTFRLTIAINIVLQIFEV